MQKWLYKFETEKNGIKRTFGISRPSRRLKEEGEIFFAAQTSKFVKAGILPKAAWNTVLSNGGGSISEQDRELYGSLLISLRDKSFELQKLLIKRESKDLSDSVDSKINALTEELNVIKNDLQAFESSQVSIFENTAEAKARNKTIMWWVTKISKEIEGESIKDLLIGESYEDKLDYYDTLEEETDKNEFLLFNLRRLTYLITLWFLGRISDEEDFKLYDLEFLRTDQPDDSSTPVVESVENTSDLTPKETSEKKENSSEIIEELKP